MPGRRPSPTSWRELGQAQTEGQGHEHTRVQSQGRPEDKTGLMSPRQNAACPSCVLPEKPLARQA
jgi:hypothetical protein